MDQRKSKARPPDGGRSPREDWKQRAAAAADAAIQKHAAFRTTRYADELRRAVLHHIRRGAAFTAEVYYRAVQRFIEQPNWNISPYAYLDVTLRAISEDVALAEHRARKES